MGIIEIFISQTVDAWNGLMHFEGFDGFFGALQTLLWSPPMVIVLVGAGLYFSIRTRFLQLRKIKKMVKLLLGGSSSEKGVSSFQAFAMAVAGRVGTGNIVGVATAIAYGGPGAMFWMWFIAFIGSGTAFVESTLAQLYKEEIDGEYRGGPAYYFDKSGLKFFSVAFMIAAILAEAILKPSVQSNAIVTAISENFGVSTMVPMIITVVLLALIIIGGTKGIAKAASILVPVMSLSYILVAILIILLNIGKVPHVFGEIFSGAFGLNAALGGSLGWAIIWGVKRGVFSNEAGQGTGAHAAAAAEVSHPAKQGLVQAFSVYFDTLLVCSATGLAILITGTYQTFNTGQGKNADGLFQVYKGYEGNSNFQELLTNTVGHGSAESISMFTPQAFNTLLTGFGGKFVAIALFFFAFTTLMAYYYYAETNLELLLKKYSEKLRFYCRSVLKVIFLCSAFFMGLKTNAAAWNIADTGFAIMVWINIIGILIISKPALLALKDFERREKAKTDNEMFDVSELEEDEKPYFDGVIFWRKKSSK
ncbi:MAG: alanine:cation symporter family protein [Bacilli bacterium]|nr:alanine:cation symporter family protein [Bacilli bacterium]